jgi:uncharacterized protein (DUF486 family)
MRVTLTTILLLTCSNIFMTFAWYAHLRNLSARPWYIAVLVSWGIAFFEYLLQVPANRMGYSRRRILHVQKLTGSGHLAPGFRRAPCARLY